MEVPMRTLLLVSLILAFCFGCATVPMTKTGDRREEPEHLSMISVAGIYSGCPVGPNWIITAEHALDDMRHRLNGRPTHVPGRWSNSKGQEGASTIRAFGIRADLVILQTDVAMKVYHPIAEEAPVPGTRVRVVGYDFSKKDIPPEETKTEITRVFAGHVFFKKTAGVGSSGACVQDAETGEVYGVSSAIVGERVGMAVGLWGRWNPLLEMPISVPNWKEF
jgi:V8-like Glu-specific endopeptidase